MYILQEIFIPNSSFDYDPIRRKKKPHRIRYAKKKKSSRNRRLPKSSQRIFVNYPRIPSHTTSTVKYKPNSFLRQFNLTKPKKKINQKYIIFIYFYTHKSEKRNLFTFKKIDFFLSFLLCSSENIADNHKENYFSFDREKEIIRFCVPVLCLTPFCFWSHMKNLSNSILFYRKLFSHNYFCFYSPLFDLSLSRQKRNINKSSSQCLFSYRKIEK